MPLPSNKLRVYPNPWSYIDHLGRPAGRLPFDGFEHSPSPGAVGARLTDVKLVMAANVMRVANRDLEVQFPQHDHRVTYTAEPVTIPATAYYRDAIRRSDLVPADAETSALAGIQHVDAKIKLAGLRKEAIERFNAETGENAFAVFGSNEPIFEPQQSPTVAANTDSATAAKGDK